MFYLNDLNIAVVNSLYPDWVNFISLTHLVTYVKLTNTLSEFLIEPLH